MRSKKNFRLHAFITLIVLGLVICSLCYGGNTGGDEDDKVSLARKELHQAIKEAKEGNRAHIHQIIDGFGKRKGDKTYVSEKLLPDYISFLKDKDAQVQFLGTQALYAINNPQSTKPLIEYLKSKNFKTWESKKKNREGISNQERYQYFYEIHATVAAVAALGNSGDKSAIPVLKSLQGVEDIRLEMVSNPVEIALAQLGSYDSLMNIHPDDNEEKIGNASGAVSAIRDPNKVPELTATLQNPKIANSIRSAAMTALTEINPPGIAELFVKIMSDPNYSQSLQCSAAIKAGKTKDKAIEGKLLEHVQDPNSFIRPYAFVGLVLCMPEKYINPCFDKIMDTNEEQEFRKNLTGVFHLYSSRNILKNYREGLYNCLNASDKDGKPIDRIRVLMWELINELYKEEPSVTLTTRDSRVTAPIRSVINLRIMRNNYRLRFPERQKMIEEEIQSIVSVYRRKSG